MRYNFTDTELKKIMKELIIITDSREKKKRNSEYTKIQKWFKDNKIKFEEGALPFGDYSAYLPKGSIKGIDRDLHFTNDVVIERKKDIDELCNNLKDKASRIKSEFAHINKYNTKFFIFIEDTLYFKHLYNEQYISKYNSKSLRARLDSICAEYKTQIVPIPPEYIATRIAEVLNYEIRSILKREFTLERIEEDERED